MVKTPNPFTPWEEDPRKITGRKEEERLFKSFMNAVSAGQRAVMAISGAPGMGKTILMESFRLEAGKNGMATVYVKTEKNESEGAVAEKIFHEWTGFGITRKKLPHDLKQLVEAMESRQGFGTVIFIDDIDRMKKAGHAIDELGRIAERHKTRKIGFVLGSGRKLEIEKAFNIELLPFDEHEARELVEKALKESQIRMGDECLNTILTETNGNPRLFKTICWHIYERIRENEKIISKGHYLAYLPAIMSMLARDWFGKLYQKTPKSQLEILQALAKQPDGMNVSDIARELGKPLGPVTALIGRLMDGGLIVRIGRGRYRIFAKLYAKYILQRSSS